MVQETPHGVAILQPGSSVATALSEGEAKEKHVIILEVLDQSFRVVKQELQTVRPFRFEQVRLLEALVVWFPCFVQTDIEGILWH